MILPSVNKSISTANPKKKIEITRNLNSLEIKSTLNLIISNIKGIVPIKYVTIFGMFKKSLNK